jgi:hypothetical protein
MSHLVVNLSISFCAMRDLSHGVEGYPGVDARFGEKLIGFAQKVDDATGLSPFRKEVSALSSQHFVHPCGAAVDEIRLPFSRAIFDRIAISP